MAIIKSDLRYLGAVRTPVGAFHYSGTPASIDFSRRQYVLGGKANAVGRLAMVPPSMPRPRNADGGRQLLDPTSVPIAPWVDHVPLIDPSNNTWRELNVADDARDGSIAEVLVVGNKAIIGGQIYYDASNRQDVSYFVCDWPLTDPTKPVPRTPWRSVANLGEGWAAGPMTIIPEPFRELLGGDVLFGQPGGLPIISRQSFGPCAISAWANDFLNFNDVPAKLLLGYHDGQLDTWGAGANDIWNSATRYTAITFVGDFLLFIGSHGYGPGCYGDGVNIHPPPPGTCFDPTASSKGTHAYPYRGQALGYRVQELADVNEGLRKYHELRPAFWFPIEFPIFDHPHYPPPTARNANGAPLPVIPKVDITGADFDHEACELHICARAQDSEGWEPGPLWHVFKVDGIAPATNPVLRLGDAVPVPVPDPDEDLIEKLKLEIATVRQAMEQQDREIDAAYAALNSANEQLREARATVDQLTTALGSATSGRDALEQQLAAARVRLEQVEQTVRQVVTGFETLRNL